MIMEATFRDSPRLWMITVFLFLMSGFLYVRPAVAFDREGNPRPFGTGGKQATVFPVWWWTFLLAVVSYLSVVWVLDYSV
jgi:hypothetical protein